MPPPAVKSSIRTQSDTPPTLCRHLGGNPDDEDEFLVVVLYAAIGEQYEMDHVSFGMLSNIDNL